MSVHGKGVDSVNRDVSAQSEVTVARFNVVSVMKFGFLVSVGLGIAFVVCVMLAWFILNSLHVFSTFEEFVGNVGTGSVSTLVEYFYFSRVIAVSVLLAILNVFVFTFISVLFAYLYNVVSSLVGGIRVILSN